MADLTRERLSADGDALAVVGMAAAEFAACVEASPGTVDEEVEALAVTVGEVETADVAPVPGALMAAAVTEALGGAVMATPTAAMGLTNLTSPAAILRIAWASRTAELASSGALAAVPGAAASTLGVFAAAD